MVEMWLNGVAEWLLSIAFVRQAEINNLRYHPAGLQGAKIIVR